VPAAPGAYFRARAQAKRLRTADPALPWTSLGPAPLRGTPPYQQTPPWSGRGTSIAVAPTNDQTAYLGTADGGVWKTTDDGVHWAPVFDAEPTLAIGAVAVDPANANVVYAGTGESNWALQGQEILLGNGIYRSTDGGSSWTHSSIPFASGYMGGGCAVSSLAVDPDATNVVVAAVFCPGTTASCATALIRSTDGGASWALPAGLPCSQGSREDEPPTATFDPAHPSTWYATISATGGDAGIWKSTDSGATWTQKFAVVPAEDSNTWSAPRGAVVVAPTDSSRLYAFFDSTFSCSGSDCLDCAAGGCQPEEQHAQFLTSADAGETWTSVGGDNAEQACYGACWSTMTLAGSPTDASTFYAGALFPVKLTDYGATMTWTQAPIHADQHGFAFDSANRLWIANDGGAYRIDSESNFDTFDNLNDTLSTFQAYRISVGSNGHIALASQDNGCDLYTPSDGWNIISAGCGDSAFNVISPNDPNVIYAAIQYMYYVLKSTDGGQSWNLLPIPPYQNGNCTCKPFLNPFAVEPGTGALLTAQDSRLWRSAGADGSDWTQISPVFNWYPGAIAVAPSDTQTIYVGSSAYSNQSNAQVAFTHDGGANWGFGGNCCGEAPVTDITVDPSDPEHAYATTSSWPPQQPRGGIHGSSQLLETTDGGVDWHGIGGGLPAAPFNAVEVDWPFSRHTIYVATDVGVFWSEDDGVTRPQQASRRSRSRTSRSRAERSTRRRWAAASTRPPSSAPCCKRSAWPRPARETAASPRARPGSIAARPARTPSTTGQTSR
jgi:hypothetical protein